jgi:hypothetical protein
MKGKGFIEKRKKNGMGFIGLKIKTNDVLLDE